MPSSKGQTSKQQGFAIGGGLLSGLGFGFFLLPTFGGLGFVGAIIAGLGMGLLISAFIKD